ncbi:MAG: hypothetical protein SGCHY_004411, partial [Lobulomycetales sp.]
MSGVMMAKDQEADSTLAWEDQQNINQFSRLNQRNASVSADHAKVATQLEYTEDLLQELELAD